MAKIPLEDISGSNDNYAVFVTDSQGNPTYLETTGEGILSVDSNGLSFKKIDDLVLDNTPIYLPISQNGQTVFNIGMGEKRTQLWHLGVRQDLNVDYTINLPLLTWTGPYPLSITDNNKIYLTYK